MITKLEKLGIISADAANQMRVLNKSGEDLGIKPVAGAQKVG
jgi:hypothetical protein